jgi:hypothetical protein
MSLYTTPMDLGMPGRFAKILTMPDTQNASSGFALRTYLDPEFLINALAQRGPGKAPERLPAKQGGGDSLIGGIGRIGGLVMMEDNPEP